jgi:2-polyprenyl-6-methoxyphenol hydroxylase-like FAD-dependent oxidoreductase
VAGAGRPVGSLTKGQGMTTGIQDTVAPAGVLANVLREGDDVRLDAWTADRDRIAEDIV